MDDLIIANIEVQNDLIWTDDFARSFYDRYEKWQPTHNHNEDYDNIEIPF